VKSSKDKLNGINPCVITTNDLVNGVHKDGKYTRGFINAACGLNAIDDKGNYEMLRTRLLKQKTSEYRLSIEEQVKCIIEQSMDLEILGRAWQGWEPFI
jgi:DNA-dependent protein kinase catalytic subunit